MSVISSLLLSSVVITLSVVALILMKAPKDWSTRFLAMALGCYALSEGGIYLFLIGNPIFESSRWIGFSMAMQGLALPHMLLFSQLFGRAEEDPIRSRRRSVVISYIVALLLFAFIPSKGLVAQLDLIIGRAFLGNLGYLYYIYSILVSVIIISNLEGTFKASDLRQRWQIKFTILGVAAISGCIIYLNSQGLLFSSLDLNYQPIFSIILILASLMLIVSMFRGVVPDVPIFISGRMLYQSLTILLVGIYLVAMGFITYGIRMIGGLGYLFISTLFVFLGLLALGILLLSESLRRRLKRFISYHFLLQQYDYRDKWMEVTQKLGNKITSVDVGKSLLEILAHTLGVNTLTMWLRSGEGETFQAFLAYGMPLEGFYITSPNKEFINRLDGLHEPLLAYDLRPEDRLGRFWEVIHPEVILPLFSEQELSGFITLGQRINKEPYSQEDLDLLTTVGRQAISSLQNARLSEELLAAREIESFHLLSTFFIHDLKNFASTLSLISENISKRFDDPEFRGDAIEAIRRVTGQMQQMVSKLSSLSLSAEQAGRQILLKGQVVDLSSIVMTLAEEVRPLLSDKLILDLKDDLLILADPDLLQNSVRNLVLNANEAIDGDGQIILRGWREGDHICLAVEDNGCGISQEFLQRELFKPFRTTKPTGTGIGLFQVKKIIEAHKGRLDVASEEGVGTTFIIRLPAVKETGGRP